MVGPDRRRYHRRVRNSVKDTENKKGCVVVYFYKEDLKEDYSHLKTKSVSPEKKKFS